MGAVIRPPERQHGGALVEKGQDGVLWRPPPPEGRLLREVVRVGVARFRNGVRDIFLPSCVWLAIPMFQWISVCLFAPQAKSCPGASNTSLSILCALFVLL